MCDIQKAISMRGFLRNLNILRFHFKIGLYCNINRVLLPPYVNILLQSAYFTKRTRLMEEYRFPLKQTEFATAIIVRFSHQV